MAALEKNHELIRLSKSCLSSVEKEAVHKVLEREFLGMGSEVKRFEDALESFFGRKVVCVTNGTAALQLAVQACGIGQGDEVLVQSLTYVASFQAISATGAIPVACDVNRETLTIDLSDAEKRLTSKTRAIMPVHYSGGVGNLFEVHEFAKAHNLRIIEDAAHAFGTTYGGKRTGSFGDVACFSLDGIKNITSGEGGAIVSDDVDLIQRVSDARLLGVNKDSERRYAGQRSWEFDVVSQGWRYHMSDIMAAIGLVQLERFPELADRRRNIARLYRDRLSGIWRLSSINHDYTEVVPHIYPVIISGLTRRDEVREKLLKRSIQTGIHYFPNHWLTYYRNDGLPSLPVTETIYPQLLTLPLHPDLTEEDVNYVCDQLLACI